MTLFGVLFTSLGRFLRGLPLALGLAVLSLAALILAWMAAVTAPVGVVLTGLAGLFVFSHLWLLLFLTAVHLRRETPGFGWGRAALRAAAWAAGLAVATVLIGAGVAALPPAPVDHGLEPAGGPNWGAVYPGGMAVWSLVAGFGLPARVMVGPRVRTASVADAAAILIALLPWLVVLNFLSLPARTCQGECWGVMEGGMVMVPLLGLWLFLLTTGAAALSAAAWSRTVRG